MKKLFTISCSVLLMAIVTVSAVKSEPVIPVFSLEGMPHEVYYAAPRPLTEGFDGEVAVIMIHGWGSGVTVPKEQQVLQNTLNEAYVLSPMYPRAQILERYGVERDDRAVWNDSWPKDLTIPGTPDDDWRGGGDANGTELSSFDVIDTLMLQDSQLRKVTLHRVDGSPWLSLDFTAPVVGLWSPPTKNAPFICIEPWYGRCDRAGYEGDYREKDWINRLAAGEKFSSVYTIEIH